MGEHPHGIAFVTGLAGRYATALFDLAVEQDALDTVKVDLERFEALINEIPDLALLVRCPVFNAREKVNALAIVLEEDAQRILRSIQNARQRADLVIVYQHNHVFDKPFGTIMAEKLPERLVPPDWLKKWTHAEVDAGADIIVMHGAPLLHGVEIYRDRPIFFDLGNFIYQLPPTATNLDDRLDDPIVWESVVAYVEFEGKTLKSVKFRPIALDKISQGQGDTRGLPRPATGDQAHYILERLADLSRPFGTNIEAIGDSAEIKLKVGN
jgi:poly-gamma-glutamate synthesis protein (capsule biosynthesis protein)